MPPTRNLLFDPERGLPDPPTGDEIRLATFAIRTGWSPETEEVRRVGSHGRKFCGFGDPPFDAVKDNPRDPLPLRLT